MIIARLLAIIVAVASSLIVSTQPASAKGTVVVSEGDGSQRVYRNVFIRVRGSAMTLTSREVKETLTIGQAECTEVGHLLRCVASDATLTQLGEARPLHLGSGTAWLDLSAKPHHLRLSFQTKAGTAVTASGTIDEFKR